MDIPSIKGKSKGDLEKLLGQYKLLVRAHKQSIKEINGIVDIVISAYENRYKLPLFITISQGNLFDKKAEVESEEPINPSINETETK